jgi:cobalamin biosynthesis protein CobD/CbiB
MALTTSEVIGVILLAGAVVGYVVLLAGLRRQWPDPKTDEFRITAGVMLVVVVLGTTFMPRWVPDKTVAIVVVPSLILAVVFAYLGRSAVIPGT